MGLETALLAASVGMSAVGSIQQGNAQKSAHDYNAAMANRAAAEKRQAAEYNANRQKESDQKLMGTMRARMGANGMDAGSGSALTLLTTTAAEADRDYRQILRNGALEAGALEGEAGLQGLYGSSAKTAGYLNAAGTLMGGLYQYNKPKSTTPKTSKYTE